MLYSGQKNKNEVAEIVYIKNTSLGSGVYKMKWMMWQKMKNVSNISVSPKDIETLDLYYASILH